MDLQSIVLFCFGALSQRAVSWILDLIGKATVLAVELSRDFAEWLV